MSARRELWELANRLGVGDVTPPPNEWGGINFEYYATELKVVLEAIVDRLTELERKTAG